MKITPVRLDNPEVVAASLARYSRSAASYEENLQDVVGDEGSGLISRAFGSYGHASVADLAHLGFAVEGISIWGALHLIDEPVWDGQERSTRYQDFSTSSFYGSPSVKDEPEYADTFKKMLAGYKWVLERVTTHLYRAYIPSTWTAETRGYGALTRTLQSRAFDLARYLLPVGLHTGVGQVVSVRTLAKQIRRLAASPYEEDHEIANALREAGEAVAPTFLKYTAPSNYEQFLHANLGPRVSDFEHTTERAPRLFQMQHFADDARAMTAAQMMFAYSRLSSATLHDWWRHFLSHPNTYGAEWVLDLIRYRGDHDEMPRAADSRTWWASMVTDIGSWRDFARHRPAVKLLPNPLGWKAATSPIALIKLCMGDAADAAFADSELCSRIFDTQYLGIEKATYFGTPYTLPLGTEVRAAIGMDQNELAYIIELRSKPGGHPAYQEMVRDWYVQLQSIRPDLAAVIRCHQPQPDDFLRR